MCVTCLTKAAKRVLWLRCTKRETERERQTEKDKSERATGLLTTVHRRATGLLTTVYCVLRVLLTLHSRSKYVFDKSGKEGCVCALGQATSAAHTSAGKLGAAYAVHTLSLSHTHTQTHNI